MIKQKMTSSEEGFVQYQQVAPWQGILEPTVPVIAAHGGVGATTLCRWLGRFAQDWGMSVPPTFAQGSPAVVVARCTAHGTARAGELVRYLRETSPVGQLVLVVVEDGLGPDPIAAKARLRAISPYIDGVVRVPYVARWRFEDDPLLRPAPGGYAKALQNLKSTLYLDQNNQLTAGRT